MTVLAASGQAEDEFVQQLRRLQQPGGSFEVVRVPEGGRPGGPTISASRPAVTLASESEDEPSANAGVRTRGMAPSAAPAGGPTGGPASAPVTVAVGAAAARSAVARDGREPLLLAMLSQLEYEQIKSSPGLHAGRRVGVLLRDPSMQAQLALVGAALPQGRRLGVLAAAESGSLVRELQRAAGSEWTLNISTVADVQSMGPALRAVLQDNDAVLLLPDAIGNDPTAAAAVLRAAAGSGVPVFGSSDAVVRSGALAAALCSPSQMAVQAQALSQRLASGAGQVTVESAQPTLVSVNSNVARSLGLRLPSEAELAQRVGAAK